MRIGTLILLFNFSLLGCGGCGGCGDLPNGPKVKEQELNVKRDFYFVRHGQTPWGPELILAGPQDLELNPTGIQQAEQAGRKLKAVLSNTSSIKIITSPLRRAIQTAQNISEITHFPIVGQEDGLKERYYGDSRLVEGSDTSQTPPDAETPAKFKERAMKALHKVLNENRLACPLIIVSHQKVFECVSEELTGKAGKLSQGGVGHFTTRDGKTWQLEILEIR